LPAALGGQDELADFTDSGFASGRLRDVVCHLLRLVPRVGDRHSQADPAHQDGVRQIVPHVADLAGVDTLFSQNLFQNGDLFDMALVDVGHLHLGGPLDGGRGDAAADDSGFQTLPGQPAEPHAILRGESFRFHHLPVDAGNVVELAVGKDAIDVHQQQLDARGAIESFSGKSHVGFVPPGRARTMSGAIRPAYEDSKARCLPMPDQWIPLPDHGFPMPDRTHVAQQFERSVAMFLTGHRLLPEPVDLGVAVSGGADSVCLLLVLQALAPLHGCRLRVLHVNHGLRGEVSDADEDFVRSLADSLQLPVHVHRVQPDDVPATGIEDWARARRQQFFAECIGQSLVDRIAVGHHRGDQAETFLFRLMRGAGSHGLGGMAPRNRAGVVRPLLGVSRRQIVDYLQARGVAWREDASNADPRFARNAIRGEWLPRLADAWNPQLESVLAGTAEQLRDESAWLDVVAAEKAQQLFRRSCFGWEAATADFAALPVALQRRVLRMLAQTAASGERAGSSGLDAGQQPAIGLGFAAVETIRDLWTGSRGHGRFLWHGLQFARSGHLIRIAGTSAPAAPVGAELLVAEGVTGVFQLDGCFQTAELRYLTGSPHDSHGSEPFDSGYTEGWSFLIPSRLSFPIRLRCWHPGDVFQSKDGEKKHKLKELFQRSGLPVWRRGHELVIESGDEIVWTSSYGTAAGFGWNGSGPALGVGTSERGIFDFFAEWESSLPDSTS
jgi:tRNA(Ile)-lysidine synthase